MENVQFRLVTANGVDELNLIQDMRRRYEEKNDAVAAAAKEIIDDVKKNSFAAVSKYSRKFDKAEP